LKFVGVPQTRQQISAVSRPKFTILSGHVEEVLLLNKFFSDWKGKKERNYREKIYMVSLLHRATITRDVNIAESRYSVFYYQVLHKIAMKSCQPVIKGNASSLMQMTYSSLAVDWC